jgi:hypothetical protein
MSKTGWKFTWPKKGPFYKAIMPLFRKWRDNLRKEFQKKMGPKNTEEPH